MHALEFVTSYFMTNKIFRVGRHERATNYAQAHLQCSTSQKKLTAFSKQTLSN